ncbi:MAG: hypothetical protein Q8930_04595 [Bacillota bacterium]|nr:hypothetical protein [Bacillota bacterium]
MVGTGRNVVVKDGRGSCVDVGNGLLNNNNVVLIVLAIVIISCCCGGGNNSFIDSCGFGRHRRRGRRGGTGALWIFLALLFLRGGNGGAPNTNTNIINLDPLLGDEGGGFLDL